MGSTWQMKYLQNSVEVRSCQTLKVIKPKSADTVTCDYSTKMYLFYVVKHCLVVVSFVCKLLILS